MTKEEFNQKIKEITENLSDQGKVTATLTELYQEYEKVFDEKGQLSTLNETLTSKNDELKNYNMELFMKVGKQEKDEEKGKDSLKDKQEGKEEPKLKYEDLFNEKGEFI